MWQLCQHHVKHIGHYVYECLKLSFELRRVSLVLECWIGRKGMIVEYCPEQRVRHEHFVSV